MALASLDWPCCSPANTPCSLALYRRRTRSRIVLASRLAVNPSSAAELRLQDPLDSARRSSMPIDEDEDEDEDGDDEGRNNCRSNSNGGSRHTSSPIGAPTFHLDSAPTPQINERERMRRERIGLANKGKTPWNKGKHHSPETIARMRERNKIVMQDPKIREKLRQHSHPQSQETREKLRISMKARMQFERRQLTIVQEWKDSIAEIARVGILGDDELQWDSYLVLKAELRRHYFSNKRKKKFENVPRSWTSEQRLKISESIRAKWADPEYRNRVIERIQQTRHRGQGKRIFKEKLSDTEFDNLLNMLTSAPVGSLDGHAGFSVAKVGSYNDPMSEEKLKKIKLLRVRNVAKKETELDMETVGAQSLEFKAGTYTDPLSEKNIRVLRLWKGKQTELGIASDTTSESAQMAALQQAQREAAEKARILLAEAERAAVLAAQALDAAGDHDESLSDSLLEAWTLLDEASKSILNMELGSSLTN